MRIHFRKGSWILLLVAAIGAIFPSALFANAPQQEPSITATFYNNFGYNSSPPLPNESGVPQVGVTSYSNINQNFDAQPMFNLYEDFIVKYQGHITSPVDGNVFFLPTADDGTQFILDGNLVDPGNWVDKGGGRKHN